MYHINNRCSSKYKGQQLLQKVFQSHSNNHHTINRSLKVPKNIVYCIYNVAKESINKLVYQWLATLPFDHYTLFYLLSSNKHDLNISSLTSNITLFLRHWRTVDKSSINMLLLICFAQNRLLIVSHISGFAFDAILHSLKKQSKTTIAYILCNIFTI